MAGVGHSSAVLVCGAALGCAMAAAGPGCSRRPSAGPPEPVARAAWVPDLDAGEQCGPYTVRTLALCLEQGRIERDVAWVASARPPGSAHHQAVQQRCAQRLAAYGYDVQAQRYGAGTNVVGIKRGFSKPDQHVVLSAHYDHLDGCPGADDNASGVAVVLETARVLSQARFDRTLIVACWDGAEAGQLGSAAYARRARARGDDIVAAVVLEAVAYASREPDSQRLPERFEERFPDQALAVLDNDHRADFLTVVVDKPATGVAVAVVRHASTVALPVHVLKVSRAMRARLDDEHRSDHVSFWHEGYSALLLTDSGRYRNPRIHCREGQDSADTLDYGFATRVARAGLGAVVDTLQLR